ncbi:MAG: hypothetical protein BV459_03195 [Thermoplasmata archaeon M11B2D]|nr:MAG: hypothetical protein BV459_03195 [Thermoplasmata archaeon M11B2D]
MFSQIVVFSPYVYIQLMTNDNMPRGGQAAFGADLAVFIGAAWYLVPRLALLWVFSTSQFFFYQLGSETYKEPQNSK